MSKEDTRKARAGVSKKDEAVYCNHCDEFYSPVSGIKEKHLKKKCRPVRGRKAKEA